jgi:hypothetical protein
MADWKEVGVVASGYYFKIFRKTENYDEALEAFEDEINERVEEEGIELEVSWEVDLPPKAISDIFAGVIKQSKEHDDEDTIGALQSHIVNKLFDAQDAHGEDQFNEWNKLLEEMSG